MADIDVVPKNRSYTWLWVILAVAVIALLVWMFAGRTPRTTQLRPAPSAHAVLVMAPSSLSAG